MRGGRGASWLRQSRREDTLIGACTGLKGATGRPEGYSPRRPPLASSTRVLRPQEDSRKAFEALFGRERP